MKSCKIVDSRMFTKQTHSAMYEVQNGCISAFWFATGRRFELFYCLAEVDVQIINGHTILDDKKRRMSIEIPGELEVKESPKVIENDVFFDFEPKAHLHYQNEASATPSFSTRATLRFFSEE